MLVFAMPKGIIKVISSLTRSFLWKGTSTSHGIFKVAWHKVIKSKSSGGLGLGPSTIKNWLCYLNGYGIWIMEW
jgi:hypothetical protein